MTVLWNSALTGTRGTYGYYTVRSNGADPTKGFITEGNIHTTNLGLFFQDAWTIGSKLTINAGLRTERERVPTYTTGSDIPEFGIEFSFKDKLAPRAGFAYDINGDGKWKAFGSWGVFYDIFKLELPRGSFGGDKWLDYNYTLDTSDWPNLLANSACPPACPGTLISGPIDFRHPSFGSDSIQPGLKPMRQEEATFGLDHQLSNVVALGVHYVHKQIDRAIEDTGSLDAGRQRDLHHRQPRRGSHRTGVDRSGDRPAEGQARLRQRRVLGREAVLRSLVPAHQLPVEPALRQLLGTVAVRRTAAAPARTSAARSTTR